MLTDMLDTQTGKYVVTVVELIVVIHVVGGSIPTAVNGTVASHCDNELLNTDAQKDWMLVFGSYPSEVYGFMNSDPPHWAAVADARVATTRVSTFEPRPAQVPAHKLTL